MASMAILLSEPVAISKRYKGKQTISVFTTLNQ